MLNELGRKWNLKSMNELKNMDRYAKETEHPNGTIIAFQIKPMEILT